MPRFTYSTLRVLLVSAALAPAACTFPKGLGDAPNIDGDTDSSGGTASTTMPTTGDEPPQLCDNPAYACAGPPDCEQWNCGALDSPFDAAGCLRQTCFDSPCAADEICYGVEQAGECDVHVIGCADDPEQGVCSCEHTDDCWTRHCIPADEGPPAECPQIDDEAECDAAGCSEWDSSLDFWRVDENDQCVLDETAPRCLWFPGDAWGGAASPGPFYEKATGRAVMFGTAWIDPPHGWGKCGDPDAPPACKCVGLCVDLQSQAAQFLHDDLPCDDVSDCAFAEGICFDADTCGNVGVHKDSLAEWNSLHGELEASGCCDGANACGASLACENNRCVAVFP